ncbi:unnamed protein product, partial [marine sediment metagenome]
AYVRGYKECIEAQCTWVLEIDAGYSHQPEEIPALLNKMAQGYDCVFGSRFLQGGNVKLSPYRLTVSWAGSFLSKILLGSQLTDMTSGFQCFDREVLKSIISKGIKSRGPFFQTEMKAYACKLDIAEVPISYNSGDHQVGLKDLNDAVAGLLRLVYLRLSGGLFIRKLTVDHTFVCK